MARKKKTVAITVDPYIWDLAKNKLHPKSRSQFIREQLKIAASIDNEEEELKKEVELFKNELTVRENQLLELEKNKKSDKDFNTRINKSMNIVSRIYKKNFEIGKNHIKYISKTYDVPFDIIEERCRKKKIKIVKDSIVAI